MCVYVWHLPKLNLFFNYWSASAKGWYFWRLRKVDTSNFVNVNSSMRRSLNFFLFKYSMYLIRHCLSLSLPSTSKWWHLWRVPWIKVKWTIQIYSFKSKLVRLWSLCENVETDSLYKIVTIIKGCPLLHSLISECAANLSKSAQPELELFRYHTYQAKSPH